MCRGEQPSSAATARTSSRAAAGASAGGSAAVVTVRILLSVGASLTSAACDSPGAPDADHRPDRRTGRGPQPDRADSSGFFGSDFFGGVRSGPVSDLVPVDHALPTCRPAGSRSVLVVLVVSPRFAQILGPRTEGRKFGGKV